LAFLESGSWFEWGGPWGVVPGLVVLLVALVTSAAWWRRNLAPLPPRRRNLLAALRLFAIALIVFLLFQPVLVKPIFVKSEQVVAVLHDDSRSMTVRDASGRTRAERLTQALADSTDAFDVALRGRFHVLEYAFGEGLRPLQNRQELRRESPETRIAGAVDSVEAELQHLALAAVIVLSDGAQQEALDEGQRTTLAEAGVPIYTVGVGESEWRDLALGDVALSRSFFDDAPAQITTQFSAFGLSGETVVAEVLQNGAVQASVERVIEGDAVEQQVQLDVIPRAREWLDYTVRLRLKSFMENAASREFVAENNEATVLLDHREKAYRILYFTGRPNWQYKFVRQALAGDPELHLSALIRVSGAEKTFVFQGRDSTLGNPLFEGFEEEADLPRYDEAVFMRMGLAEGELADGYPVAPEALYPFHLIIWSDIEADFFAPAQLQLTRDAVAERGASFLMLGGPETLGGGDYGGSLIESMLPVLPGAGKSAPGAIAPSPEGFLTGVWALKADGKENDAAWAALPALPGTDPITSPRIGASILATASTGAGTEPFPFLVQHRYGQGKSAVLATGETWPWHMQTESDNQDHARLWRQLVRSLASSVPEPVSLAAAGEPVVVADETTLTWVVKDGLFKPVEGATLTARVTSATGETSIPLAERLDAPGTYEGTFTPAAAGKHGVFLEGANATGEAQAPVEAAVLVASDTREAMNARFDPTLLQSLAQESGGRYFPLEQLKEVAAAITAPEQVHASVERVPLWHHPIFYGLLVMTLCAEWTLRRRWGQA
jgi:uncharacterized membrane protein